MIEHGVNNPHSVIGGFVIIFYLIYYAGLIALPFGLWFILAVAKDGLTKMGWINKNKQ